VRDSQKWREYRFENLILHPMLDQAKETLTQDECLLLVKRSRELFGFANVPIQFSNHSRRWARAWISHIVLPPWAMTPLTVMHEVAHTMTQPYKHGPYFVRAFLILVARYYGVSLRRLKALAREHRVKVAGSFPPGRGFSLEMCGAKPAPRVRFPKSRRVRA